MKPEKAITVGLCAKCHRTALYAWDGSRYCAKHMIEHLTTRLEEKSEACRRLSKQAEVQRLLAERYKAQWEAAVRVYDKDDAPAGAEARLEKAHLQIAGLYEDLEGAYRLLSAAHHHLAGDY